MRQEADLVLDCCWILEAELAAVPDYVELVELEEDMRGNHGEMLDVLDSKVSRLEKDDHNSPVEGSHVAEVIWKKLAWRSYTRESNDSLLVIRRMLWVAARIG